MPFEVVSCQGHRWAVPRYFFSTGTVGTLEKSAGIAMVVHLFFNFWAVVLFIF